MAKKIERAYLDMEDDRGSLPYAGVVHKQADAHTAAGNNSPIRSGLNSPIRSGLEDEISRLRLQHQLGELKHEVENCTKCVLGQTRTHVVFGAGNPQARVLILGEAPGKNEDLEGKPFIGAAGKKLESLLLLAGLTREDVYIANVVKCRPPSNRNPKPEEITACAPFLRAQIRLIWPEVILCLGNFATQFVMHSEQGVTNLRGQMYQVGRFWVVPTFHPAACIYHPSWQPLLEDDLKMLGAWLVNNPRN